MGETVRKSMPMVITDPGNAEDPFPGSFEAVLATPDVDREGEAIKANEWKSMPDSIPINADHDMTSSGVIGSATPSLGDDGKVYIKGTYSSDPDAQRLRTKVNEKHIRSMSVEFMRTRVPSSEKGGLPVVTRELVGGAFTPYPINPNARVLTSKAGARNNKSDASNIQSIHDASASLGADCAGAGEKAMKALTQASRKALSGSVEDLKNRLSDELCEFYGGGPDLYVWICATFLDSMAAGTVVYEYNGDTYSQTFTDDGTTATVDGAPQDVSLITSVVLEDKEDPNTVSTSDSAKSVATSHEDVATKSADEQALDLQCLLFDTQAMLANMQLEIGE